MGEVFPTQVIVLPSSLSLFSASAATLLRASVPTHSALCGSPVLYQQLKAVQTLNLYCSVHYSLKGFSSLPHLPDVPGSLTGKVGRGGSVIFPVLETEKISLVLGIILYKEWGLG